MTLLELIVKTLINIGSPLVKFLKLVGLLIKRVKSLKRVKITFPKIKVNLVKISFKKLKVKVEKTKEFLRELKKTKNKKKKAKKIKEKRIIKKEKVKEKKSNKIILNKKNFWIINLLSLFLFLSLSFFYLEIVKELPNVDLIYSPPNLSTKILDRNGEILYKFYQNENRTWVDLEKIPTSLIEATLAIEDKDFYKHYGLSFKGLSQAIIYNFKKDKTDKPRGGSTISQQLVKNVFFSSEKTLERKMKEAILTLMVENKLSKDQILERYLNQVPYGGEAYGVEEASQKYFGKHVWEISKNEAAYLAGLPAAPSSYSPYGNNPSLGFNRQKMVIEEMKKNGFLSEEEINEMAEEELEIKSNNKAIEAPHFVFYIRKLLEDQGYINFERQGLLIKTSLDLKLQNEAQKIVSDEVERNKGLRIYNGGALVVDVKNGDILAMVGSKDYYSEEIDGKYNVTTALRQPGSSIKPINYLLALENNFSLASIINDSPITYYVEGQKPYSPRNYNGKYMGEISLRTALGSSLNIPSVKLLEKNGVSKMIDLAEDMGINSWGDRKRFGLSLALGSGEVKMTELAQAYSIFANLGEKIEIEPILEIKNYLGEKVYEKDNKSKRIVREEYAYMINSVLSDDKARSPIFGSNSKLVIKDKTVAVKTGTTNNLRDNWCIGWTPSILVASWVGNNDGSPMSWVASGISGATPIWNELMSFILEKKEDEKWLIPNGLVRKNVCGQEEWFLIGSEIKTRCPIKKDKENQENIATN